MGKFNQLAVRYSRNERGNFLIIAAVFMMVMVIGVSLALDMTSVNRSKSKLQDSADAAVLAAATAIYHQKASDSAADLDAKKALRASGLKSGSYHCKRIERNGERISIDCSGKVKTAFSNIVGKPHISFDVESVAMVGQKPKVEIALVYDISDSMLADNKLIAMERALSDFLDAEVFTNPDFETVFSLIPFANSVAFRPEFEKWIDPVDGYSISPSFNRCFMPDATDPRTRFQARNELTAAPERLSNKGHTYCPVAGLEARFFLDQRSQASGMISNITTSNGTGSSEALMWGYRALIPDMKGVFADTTVFPRYNADDHKKILIFLTDGKPRNKPWVGKAKDDPDVNKNSERMFLDACKHIKSNGRDIDMHMVGYGKLQRSGDDLSKLLEQCTSGKGEMFLADNRSLSDTLLGIVSIHTDIALVD